MAAPVQPGPPPGFVPLSRRPAPSAAASRVRLSARGERLAGFIYGTIVALSRGITELILAFKLKGLKRRLA